MMKQYIGLMLLAIALVAAGCIQQPGGSYPPESKTGVKTFSSYAELSEFLATNAQSDYGRYGIGVMADFGLAKSTAVETATTAPSADYSKTNIQVEGVDEADIVKSDGKYIYTITGNQLVIVEAYPAESAKLAYKTELKGTPSELFVKDDRLVVFGSAYEPRPVEGTEILSQLPSPYYASYYSYIQVYDVSSREKPRLIDEVKLTGNYFSSRMIGDKVYAVVNMPTYHYYGEAVPLPAIRQDGKERLIQPTEIQYFPYPDVSYSYVTIVAIDIKDPKTLTSKTYLAGDTQTMYVSQDNIYLAFTRYRDYFRPLNVIENAIMPVLPPEVSSEAKDTTGSEDEKQQKMAEVINRYLDKLTPEQIKELDRKAKEKMIEYEKEIAREREKTIIHKISIKDGRIEYDGEGSVPGTVLNQFSMDEHNGKLRIATTTGRQFRFRGEDDIKERNNVYVLDEDLEIVGRLEDLAPGEKIYSARFMGERTYLVTFKKTDPLFVIDLKEPENPKVLGQLKIPGYSDYLHPYDENHIIGIGKEAAEAENGDFAWYQGVKIALFDVSDPANPKEISKFNIGDRGTDSYALQDHHAFLFSREKGILVMPISLAEIDPAKYDGGKVPPYAYGEQKWQGAYVMKVTLQDGIQLRGRISHLDELYDGNDYYYSWPYYYSLLYSIKRSLYIGDTLYTVSDRMVKANNLEDLKEIKAVEISHRDPDDWDWMPIDPIKIMK